MFSGTTLILLPQSPVVAVVFHLWSADGDGGGGGLIREFEKEPANFIFSK